MIRVSCNFESSKDHRDESRTNETNKRIVIFITRKEKFSDKIEDKRKDRQKESTYVA